MTDSDDQPRHLTLSNVEALWASGNSHALPVSGNPTSLITLRPSEGKITLTTPYVAPAPDVSRLSNLDVDVYVDGGEEMIDLIVTAHDNVVAEYGLLCIVTDYMQNDDLPLPHALAHALDDYRDLLGAVKAMTQEREVGLFGELLVLEHLFGEIGVEQALSSWLGPNAEEHDFVFEHFDSEVKTTTSEKRSHVIGGLEQLVASPGRPLAVVSIQLTKGSPATGRSLSDLALSLLADAGAHAPELRRLLDLSGWRVDDSDLYQTCWLLRSDPRCFNVDKAFPRMVPADLKPAVPRFDLISQVSYRIDLTDFPHSAASFPLGNFTEGATATHVD